MVETCIQRRRSRGMTLVELLVTMGVAILLLAIALPTVKFTLESSRVREASRQVNTFIAGAKARAAGTGRSVGIWLERDTTNFNSCSKLFLAEVPPSMSGSALNSTVSVVAPSATAVTLLNNYNSTAVTALVPVYQLQDPPGSTPPITTFKDQLVRAGTQNKDRFRIQFDHKGPWFFAIRLDDPNSMPTANDPYYIIYYDNATYDGNANTTTGDGDQSYDLMVRRGAQPPSTSPGSSLPFAIQGAPRRIDFNSLELPRGTAIDLSFSGDALADNSGNFLRMAFGGTSSNTVPVVLMFRPDGQIEAVHYEDSPHAASGTVHLLVARVEKILAAPAVLATYQTIKNSSIPDRDLAKTFTLYDPESLWVSVGHRSGTISTVDNNTIDPADGLSNRYLPFDSALPAGRQHNIAIARKFASVHQSKGGH